MKYWFDISRNNFILEETRHHLARVIALSQPYRHSALAGAAMIYLAPALPFIASDAAVAVIRISLLFF